MFTTNTMNPILPLLTFLFILIFGCAEKKSENIETASIGEMETTEAKSPENQQIITVHTPDWDSKDGELRRFEWNGEDWAEIGQAIPIVVGKRGMGWGVGIENYTDQEGPVKKEGDLKSPAGVFKLGAAFGYANPEKVQNLKTDYIHVTKTTMCIEDGTSAYYNQIIDENEAKADWNSTDHMLRKDDLYEWGMFVAHNSPEAANGGGSCIFLHVAEVDDDGTAGCTAMAKPKMLEIIQWVDVSKNPILIQSPKFTAKVFHDMYDLSRKF